MSSELHSQVASESVRALDNDAADAIASNPVEHSLEARPLTNRIGAAHSGVIKLINQDVAVRLGKGRMVARCRRSFVADEVRR